MPTATLTSEQFQRIARALSDPTRYEMLRRIYAAPGTINCGASCCDLSISPGTASHHLRELEAAGLVEVTRDGRYKLLAPRREIWQAYLAQLNAL